MRYTDYFFFGTIFTVLLVVFTSIIGGFDIPDWFTIMWWVVLLPIAMLKAFFKDSKIVSWLEKERHQPKNEEGMKRDNRKKQLNKLLKW